MMDSLLKTMKIKLSLFLTFIFISAFCPNLYCQNPAAIKGVLDLRQIPNKDKFLINLNGEWEFYWKKMLHPHDFNAPLPPKPDIYGKVPSYWTDYSHNNFKTEKYGYATYHLTILLPKNIINRLAFDLLLQ